MKTMAGKMVETFGEVMPPKATTTKKHCQYDQKQMEDAIEAVRAGQSLKSAAKTYGVPRMTLSDKVKGKTAPGRNLGAPSVLTKNEEQIVVDWILSMSSAGFPVTKAQIIASVTEIVKKLGRSNPFKSGIPGRFWWEGFRKRHPELAVRVPQNLTASRAAVTETQLKKWFSEVEAYLEKEACFPPPKKKKTIAPSKIPSNSNASTNASTQYCDEDFARKFDKMLGPEKLKLFRKCHREGRAVDIEDTSLFRMWKDLPRNTPIFEESSLLSESDSTFNLLNNDEEFLNDEGQEIFQRDVVRENDRSPQTHTSHQPSTSTPKDIDDDKNRTALTGVPSPFKSVSFWPDKSSTTGKGKRKAPEKMSTVVTSILWQAFAQKKINEKENKLQIQIRKKEEPEEKKKAREEAIKRKKLEKESKAQKTNPSSESSDSSSNVTSGEIVSDEPDEESKKTKDWEPVQKYVNEYVAFKYDGKFFPGKIISLGKEDVTISAMVRSGRLWKWPDRADILTYPYDAVLGHINSPKKTSKTRNVFVVEELSNFVD